jgi:hypothetical protein
MGPLLAGVVAAVLTWHVALLATPFALMRVAMKRLGARAEVNAFLHSPPTSAEHQIVVRPSPDLLYSICVFDVSRGPVLVDVPPIDQHYWSVSVFDARTDVAAVRSDRDTGGAPARLALLGSGQSAPRGYEAVPLAYPRGIALIRVLVSGEEDVRAVDRMRQQATCQSG